MSKYNGHPSWDHWNVTLWLNNTNELHTTLDAYARGVIDHKAHPSDMAAEMLVHMREYHGDGTPDGAEWSHDVLRYAIECHIEAVGGDA